MKVTVHGTFQKEPFLVNGSRFLSGERHIISLDIRQPHEDINNGITFILESPTQLRDLIMSLVEVCERLQAEEIAEQDARLKAKVHAVLDAQVAMRARGVAPAPSQTEFFADGADDPNEGMYAAAKAEAR